MKIDNTKPIITLDFDGTLSTNVVQQFYHLIKDKANIFILTKRYDCLHKHLWKANPTNDIVWEVVNKLGIPPENVFFTNFEWKHRFLKDTFVLAHLDDDNTELELIMRNTTVIPISVYDDFQTKILNLINKWES